MCLLIKNCTALCHLCGVAFLLSILWFAALDTVIVKVFSVIFQDNESGFFKITGNSPIFLSASVLNPELNWEFWCTELSNEPGSGLVKLSLYMVLRKERKSKVRLFYAQVSIFGRLQQGTGIKWSDCGCVDGGYVRIKWEGVNFCPFGGIQEWILVMIGWLTVFSG